MIEDGFLSDRGLFYWKPVKDTTANGVVKVSESSAIMRCGPDGDDYGPFMWLRIDTDIEAYHSAGKGEGIAHLSTEAATLLRDQITDWLEHK